MEAFSQLSLFDLSFDAVPVRETPASSPPTPTQSGITQKKPDSNNPSARSDTRSVVGSGNQTIHFHLRRSSRKTIGFLIDDRGLTVSSPRWVTLQDIDQAVIEKSAWISKKLIEWRKHQDRRKTLETDWRDGGQFRYLGQHLTMQLSPLITGVKLVDKQLLVGLPADASADRLRDATQAWVQSQAKLLFADRLERLAMLTGHKPKRWALTSARSRWGSCTSDGTIRLNWRLMHFPLDVIDYVIAHELAHLSEMNHGPKFWDKVAEFVPDYKAARAQLINITDDM